MDEKGKLKDWTDWTCRPAVLRDIEIRTLTLAKIVLLQKKSTPANW